MAIRSTSPGFTRGSSSLQGIIQHKGGASHAPVTWQVLQQGTLQSTFMEHGAAARRYGHAALLGSSGLLKRN